jgi:hypothetical protein
MFTEEEAATKWCPFDVARSTAARCIGSECMVWQWGPKPALQTPGYPAAAGQADRKGYCGLCHTQWKP